MGGGRRRRRRRRRRQLPVPAAGAPGRPAVRRPRARALARRRRRLDPRVRDELPVPVLRVLRGGGQLGGEPHPDAGQGHPLVHQADTLLASKLSGTGCIFMSYVSMSL